MKDELGDRIKSQYEDRTRVLLPRRTYTMLRLDGKAFHTYTKSLNKPFDKGLSEDIDNAIIALMGEIQGATFAYTQSDEISILLTDFAQPTTSAWFDGNLQKIVSVSASIMTAEFNKLRFLRYQDENGQIGHEMDDMYPAGAIKRLPYNLAYFDCRAFTIPDRIEVMNAIIWRNQDCIRNSISMVAYNTFPHKELQSKSTKDKLFMLKEKGIDWDKDFTEGEKYGRLIVKEEYVPETNLYSDEFPKTPIAVKRTRWVSQGAWKFTDNKDKLLQMIPKYEN